MGRDRKTDPAAYDVSLFLTPPLRPGGFLSFGYLTRDGDDGEPEGNHGYGHGDITGGIITTNDCMYLLGNGYLLLEAATSAYVLALAKRSSRPSIWGAAAAPSRPREMERTCSASSIWVMIIRPCCSCHRPVPAIQAYPTGKLLPDAQPDETVVGGNNDYRTYYPRVGSGIGEMNTARYVIGWIARACWDGEGPYYYAPEKSGHVRGNGAL